MCYTYTITFPGCRSHKVTTFELCNDRQGELQRLASTPTFCCGLFGSSRPKERKVCTPEPRWILRNEPCPTCLRNSRVSSKTQTKKKTVDAYRPPPPPPQAYQRQQTQTPPMQQGFLNERQMQSMMKLQETYRGKAAKRSSSVYSADEYYGPRPVAAAPVKGYARRPVPSYLATKALPPVPLRIRKQGAGAPKQTPPRRPRRSEPPPSPVRYDDEPVPDDDFIDMVYSYSR